VAPPRVQQYLRAEIDHIRSLMSPGDWVLELGCGYGRVLFELDDVAGGLTGIDPAVGSLEYGQQLANGSGRVRFAAMDAAELGFAEHSFDLVLCVQNGICAFGTDQARVLGEAVRVCRSQGRVLLSSYADEFWPHRLEWFELQSAHGLLGEIDHEATGDGVIACKDGFRSGRMRSEDFEMLARRLGLGGTIEVVDGSITFCEVRPDAAAH